MTFAQLLSECLENGSLGTPRYAPLAIVWLLPVLILGTACEQPVGAAGQTEPPLPPAPPGTRVGYYVAPNGSPSGDGSATRPWDLATAFAAPAAVHPGDTVWLRGGIYNGTVNSLIVSKLTGTAATPIIVRQYPGERAIISGPWDADGAYAWYWGFESITSTTEGFQCIVVTAPGVKLINLIVHDCGGGGVFGGTQSPDAEIYGSIIYNTGFNGSIPGVSFGHGIYVQNQTGTKRIKDNVLFNQYGYGFHGYGASAPLNNFTLDGNAIFNSGLLQGRGQPNILIGGGTPVTNAVLTNNMTYRGLGIWVGYSGTQSSNVTITNNYLMLAWPVLRVYNFNQAVVAGNTLYSLGGSGSMVDEQGPTAGYQWNSNRYHGDSSVAEWVWTANGYTFPQWRQATGLGTSETETPAPTGSRVFVRPNQYEPGRANIIIYNWARAATVPVDVSSILSSGDRYEVRNVQDLFGPAVLSGTYAGGTLSIPMTAVQPPTPIWGWGSVTPPITGPDFNTFVLLRTAP